MATEEKELASDKVVVELGRKYTFGSKVTVSILTMGDEENIEKQIVKNDGVGEKLFSVMASCGLTKEEASEIVFPDANKIVKVLHDFR